MGIICGFELTTTSTQTWIETQGEEASGNARTKVLQLRRQEETQGTIRRWNSTAQEALPRLEWDSFLMHWLEEQT